MEQTTVNQRIESLVEHYCRGNKSAFAKAVGITSQSLGEIVGGRQSAPSFVALQKIALAYPSVSLQWLVLGQGPMIELTNADQSHQLERFADEVEEKYADMVKSGEWAADDISFEFPSLENARAQEEVARINFAEIVEKERLLEAGILRITGDHDLLPDLEQLDQIKALRRVFEVRYFRAVRIRMRVERAQFGFNTSSVTAIYKLGDVETDGLYEGLLTTRLGISNEAAEKLVKSGKIRATYIDGEGYRITEQAVRAFLGEF